MLSVIMPALGKAKLSGENPYIGRTNVKALGTGVNSI
jgi:hypothetical protein